MKLRISFNQLRFRLDKPEVTRLGNGQSILLSTHFGSGSYPFHSEIIPDADVKDFQAAHEEGAIVVRVPIDQASSWAKSEDEGIYGKIKTEIGDVVELAIERDYPCKH